ncbi:uncharacterized protein B0H18DRAFT_872320 [Fomitopsis serialis]|uniref:uncharacterized protein n=1 Tax=Fomitopsis serialis TaxID=139415 RepID=UPI0020077884|nr:uncharacterized protein B0H18DRAFT_872320 [Neoantrodia serialis]KAH9931368.1 hypothetical protein B0H18DRAFT_872320 [Neoantrodia serialis]
MNAERRSSLGPFDARCAADAEDHCNIITTPWMDWIPEFPRIAGREIVTFRDGLWGPQEYTRWPQMYNEGCVHHACIPTRHSDYAPGNQVYDGLGYDPWEESPTCGVLGFGYLKSDVLQELHKIAARTIMQYEQADSFVRQREDIGSHQSSVDRRLGGMLCLLLRNAVDRLRALPSTELHTLVTARMAHRLILELAGLSVYYSIVVPRVAHVHPLPRTPLKVLGAFVRNDAAAQLLHRVGVPFWYIRPWSADIYIRKVVKPCHWQTELSDEPAWPRIPKSWYDPDGTHQDPSRWTHPSVIFVSNLLCSSALPRLQVLARPDGVESDAKRHKGDDATKPIMAGPQVPPQTRNSKKRGKRARGGRRGAKTPDSHPATTFEAPPSDLVRLSPNWTAALSDLSPLPFPPPVALEYFFPPPFVVYHAETQKARYIHNFTRIREYCRHRLVDAAINGTPLRIADWRHVLHGDYRLDDHDEKDKTGQEVQAPGNPPSSDSQKRSYLYERSQCVRRLFAKGGSLLSYDERNVSSYRGMKVTLEAAKTNHMLKTLVLWELYETNWRCELRALDNLLVDHSDDAFRQWEREQRVAEVWRSSLHQTAFSVVDVSSPAFCWTPAGEEGWQGRRRNLQALLRVMSAWPQVPEMVRANATTIGDCDDAGHFDAVEATALKFYVKTFASKFDRLPCPPVQLVSPP